MVFRSTGRGAARFLLTAGLGLWAVPALAQQAAPAPNPTPPATPTIDPNAPLDPMPDLGVAWPDMATPDAPATTATAPNSPTPASPTTAAAAASATAPTAGESVAYTVRLDGLDALDADAAKAVRSGFDEQSALVADRKKSANAAQLDRRARADSDLVAELLRSQGYYDAEAEARIDVGTGAGGGAGRAVAVVIVASPGSRYRFASVTLPGLDAAGAETQTLRDSFAVRAGDPVVAQKVIDAGTALQAELGARGFATFKVGERDIVVDHATREARLVLPVTPGPVARFGRITVSGKPGFSPRHVAVIARFRRGDRFEEAKLTDLRRALIATGLVSVAEVREVPVDGGRTIDLAVHLEPAPPRTISGEAGYGTGEGVKVTASWQHRNFINPEGALTLQGVLGTQEQGASVSLRRSNFRRRDVVATLLLAADHTRLAAYDAKTLTISGRLERQSTFLWQKRWTWHVGTDLLGSNEVDTDATTGVQQRRTFLIAALPVGLTHDDSDSLLDPTRGFRLGGWLSPEFSLQAGARGYVRGQIDASAYRPVNSRTVIAARVRLGTILGASRDEIAPSRRFYSGGGGSVRGYGYQELGPRDANGKPIGGRSLAEFSIEARYRIGNFGIVPFLDGGTLSTGASPRLNHWQLGAGVGARYYSSFGPIRIDVGTPLNRQAGDSRIAVVVSLGQAF
ncbi:BamA/TamA family outer membrane protein [Sphingomonas sp. ASV193]|uniref:autotransporter assembly complex protein TamA n=1 Tax=Sphingomonas sp. ASV193 TaxID=3144405 RepID=UPI0032E87CA9